MPVIVATPDGVETPESGSDDSDDSEKGNTSDDDEHPSPKKPKLEPKSGDAKEKKPRKTKS